MIRFDRLTDDEKAFVRRLAPTSSRFATGIYTEDGLQELALLWNHWWTHFERIFTQNGRQGLLDEFQSLKSNVDEISKVEKRLTDHAHTLREQWSWQKLRDQSRQEYEARDRSIRHKLLVLEDRKQHLESQLRLLEYMLFRWDESGDTKRPEFLLAKDSVKPDRIRAVITLLEAFTLYEERHPSRVPKSRSYFGRFIENHFKIKGEGTSLLRTAERTLDDVGGHYEKWHDYDTYKRLFTEFKDDFLEKAAKEKVTAFPKKS